MNKIKSRVFSFVVCGCVFFFSSLAAQEKIAPAHDSKEALGMAFSEYFNERDADKLAELFDLKAFSDRIGGKVFSRKSDIKDFTSGFMSSYGADSTFVSDLMGEGFQASAQAKFLRVSDGEPVVRIDYPEGGHEYMLLEFGAKKNINKIVDIFLLSSGKYSTDAIAGVVQLVVKPSTSALKRFFDVKEINEDVKESLAQIFTHIEANESQKAYDLIEALPQGLRASRSMIDMALTLGEKLNDTEYRKQLSRLDKFYGNDPGTSFMLIDHHFYNEDYAKASASVERIQKKLGNDAALEGLMASLTMSQGKFVEMAGHAKKAIALEPDFEDGYWVLISAYNSLNAYDKMVPIFKQIETLFDYEFVAESFAGDEYYTEFIKSKEFLGWMSESVN